ncbi:hypothetical protein [Macrococcoides caseolyticum]|nr:hypothetical protein [Macrococcus caseolyticus]MCE4955995.1 hypothetical protein [Macrococcus caseolyticus]
MSNIDKDTTSNRRELMPESVIDGEMNEKVKAQLELKPGEKKVSKEDQDK